MEQTLAIFKALSDRSRLRIVASLMEFDELCVCQILELLQVSGATASRHLSQLIHAGLLTSRKEGRWVYYRLNSTAAGHLPLLNWLHQTLGESVDLQNDRELLAAVTACEPENISRKQRSPAEKERIGDNVLKNQAGEESRAKS